MRTIKLRTALGPSTTYLTGRPGLYASTLKEVFEEDFDVIHFRNPSLLGGPGLLSYGTGTKFFTLKNTGSCVRCTSSCDTTVSHVSSLNAFAALLPFGGRRSSGGTRGCSSASYGTSIFSCHPTGSRRTHTGAAASRSPSSSYRTSCRRSKARQRRRHPPRTEVDGPTSSTSDGWSSSKASTRSSSASATTPPTWSSRVTATTSASFGGSRPGSTTSTSLDRCTGMS